MHRQLFNQAKGFQSSLPEFEFDMNPVDPKSGEHLNKMRDTKLTENYRISIADKFVSPFYPDSEFVFTRSFQTKSRVGSHVRGIAINPLNNKNVVVVSKKVIDFNITQEDLNSNFEESTNIENEDEWAVVGFKTEE